MPSKVKTTFQCIFLKEGLVENTTHKFMKKRKLNLWRLYVVSFSPVNEVKAETQVRYIDIFPVSFLKAMPLSRFDFVLATR